jgi:integrase
MSRLAHGDGSVYFEESRNRWVGTLDIGVGANGKRQRRKVTGATSRDVHDRLKQLRKDLADGADLTAGRMTVTQLLEKWQRDAMHSGNPSPNTIANFEWAVTKHLVPAIGPRRLEELRVEHVEAMLTGMADAGRARNTCLRVRNVLQQALNWAMRRGYVIRNVADLAELPSGARRQKQGRALTADQARALLAASTGSRLEALWNVSLCLGLRPGEASGLLWSDVDLDENVVHVRRSMKWKGDKPLGLDEVKTGNTGRGRRSLIMPPQVTDAFRRHRVNSATERLAAGPSWPAEWSELVFVSQAGTPLSPRNLRRELGKMATKAKIGEITRYDLRHSAATLLADMGLRIEEIADILGHETTRMSRAVYVHAQARPLDAAAAAMTALA